MCSLANKLMLLRKKRNLTKKEVAEAVGVHPSSIGNLEKGSIPQGDLLFLLAQFYNVSMEYLMDSTISENEFTQFESTNLTSRESSLLNLFSQLAYIDQEEIYGIMKLKLELLKGASEKFIESNKSSSEIA